MFFFLYADETAQYYFKKLKHQELGSVSDDGRAQRGRYVYISKDTRVLQLFPPLSEVVENDCSMLPFVPIYQGDGNKIYASFVYHNDKLTRNGTRNEYRLYLNASLENQAAFREDDIVIIRKGEMQDDEEDDDNRETVYFLDVLQNHTSDLYRMCDTAIENSGIRGGHAVYEGYIEEFENRIENLHTANGHTVIDNEVTNRVMTTNDAFENLFTQASFRDFVMAAYDYKCAITRNVIIYENFYNLEAAHIKPRSHGGVYLPNNGMALSRDLHWAFDKGFFTLDDDYRIIIHPRTNSDYLSQFNHQQIYLPEQDFFKPNLDNIHYHRDEVYGRFLETGRL